MPRARCAGIGRRRPRLEEVAGHPVARRGFSQDRLFLPAPLLGMRTASVKTASCGRLHGARDIAVQDDALAFGSRVGSRNRRQQRLGLGMKRAAIEGFLVGDLDQLAEVHHRDAVADVLDHCQVMRDEEIGKSQPLLQIL